MKIVELSNTKFDEYAMAHPLSNYCQASKYALVMTDFGYSYDYIAMVDDENRILAATLVLTKRIKGSIKYGYSPKGFLLNFYDKEILKTFLKLLTDYYKKQDFIFIKFNPEIIIGETSLKDKLIMNYNGNVRIIDDLKAYNVKRRLELKEFDLMMPKFNAYIDLKNFDIMNIDRNFRKKIRHGLDRGLHLTIGNAKEIDILYNFLKNKTKKPISYFRNIYNVFSRDNSMDLVFVKIDFQTYLNNVRKRFDEEQVLNDNWNNLLQVNPGERRYVQRKMNSDKIVESLKSKIIYATNELKRHPEVIVAAALVVKHRNRISIIASGYSDEYKQENPNHFLHYAIFERYKPYFSFCDIGGVTGNFEETSQYKGLNDFKLKFNAKIYEYIGEFDLICSERTFKKLIKTSFIEDEFNNE
ncbi:MAG: peptidoglycan bridge formation glycyltransferase FemA/FemB family protein [Erysipelotrichales bacterium]|nr:peptidoglycan bridge formation glycyltransferase FemA/FemB family protein [Erysipelotrichales bacterium]